MIKPAPRATDPDTIRAEILEKLAYSIGKDPAVAKRHDWRAGCGARQWRPRAARRLLHGEHGEPGIPAYRLRHPLRHGLFRQEMSDGWQVELPEDWLEHGNPWEFERRESAYEIGFGGRSRRRDRATAASATSGSRPRSWWPSPTTRRSSAGAASG
jgi:hypothetical protein